MTDAVPTWDDVAASDAYQNADPKTRESARVAYFNEVVAPRVNPTQLPEVRKLFDEDTTGSTTAGDVLKTLGSGALNAVGETLHGGGALIAAGVNKVGEAIGHNPELRAVDPLQSIEQAIEDSRTYAGKRADRNFKIEGDTLSPSTWKVSGFTPGGSLQFAARTFGQYAPQVLLALVTGGASVEAQAIAGAAVGGLQGFGGGATQEHDFVMNAPDDELQQKSTFYKSLIDQGVPPDAARDATAKKAELGGGLGNGIPSALEGAIEQLVLKAKIPVGFGKGAVRAVTGAVTGAAGQGAEEDIEQRAQNLGSNLAIGGNRPLGEDTLSNAVGGFVGGAGFGGGASHLKATEATNRDADAANRVVSAPNIDAAIAEADRATSPLALPAPTMYVSPEGAAGTEAQRTDLGMTPDIDRAAAAQQERDSVVDAEIVPPEEQQPQQPLLPAPTMEVSPEGEAATQAQRQDLGITPDIRSAIQAERARILAMRDARLQSDNGSGIRPIASFGDRFEPIRLEPSTNSNERRVSAAGDFTQANTGAVQGETVFRIPSAASRTIGKIDAFPSQLVVDIGTRSDAKHVGDLIDVKSIRDKPFEVLDAPSQRIVLASVIASVGQPEVLKSVVGLDAVNVVNQLTGKQFTPEMLLHDKAMLKNAATIDVNSYISSPSALLDPSSLIRSVDTVKSALAERIAEIPLVINHVTPRTMPGSSTEIASEGSHGSVSSKPGDIVPSGSSALPAVSSQERRQDAARRKHTEEMSPDELRRELLTDSLTGLGNRRAYEEAEKKPVQGVVDIDSLKYVNDNLGHEAGDKIIEATGRALRESGVEAYRIGGDEFAIQSHDHAALDRALTEASNRLANAEVVAELPDGTTITKKGVNFTHGIGPDRTQADLALNRAKTEREAQGLRAARGETPRGLTRTAARVQDQGNPVAAAQDSEGVTSHAGDKVSSVVAHIRAPGRDTGLHRPDTGAVRDEGRGGQGGSDVERNIGSTLRTAEEAPVTAASAASTPPKGGVSVSAPRTIDFDSFAAERGASRQDFGEPALSKNISGAEKDRAVRRQAERDRILQGSRERLRAEYDQLVAEGKIKPPTSAEQLHETAAGHPDNQSTQAAQRALAKRAERLASQKTGSAPTDRDKRLVPVSKRTDAAEKTAAEGSERASGSAAPEAAVSAKFKFSLNKTESAVNKLNERLANQNGEAWRNAYVRSELDKSQSRLAQAFKAAFGTDIVGIKPTDKRFADVGGMHVGGVTYINTDFKEHGFVQLAGHELLHQIRRERPNIYDWFSANAQNYLKKGAQESYRSRLEKAGADMRSTDVREEILADFVGDALADREFLDHLASRNKTKFRMLVDYVVKWLNKTAQKLKMAGFGSSQYFTDVRGLQGYLSGVLDAYRSDAATGSENVKFSRSLGKESEPEPESRIIGDSGRDYTQAQREAMARTGSTVTKRSIADTIKSIRQNAAKSLVQGIVDQFAPVKDISTDAYKLLRLSKGATGAFEAFMHHGKLNLKDGAYDADTSGGVMQRVFIPLGKETTDFLRWIAGNRAERLMGEGKERLFTPADIEAFKSLEQGTTNFDYTLRDGMATRDRTLIYRDALAKFNEFNKNVLDMAEQSGLIDGESRRLWEHEFYVPFFRNEEDGGFRGMNIKSGVVRQQAFKKLKGGEHQLNDLLGNTLMNWAHLIDASAKNRAAKATLEAAAAVGAAREAEPGEKKTVWYMDGGKKKEYVVDDPHLMTAISALEYAGLRGPAMAVLSTFKHWLTTGVTSSPFFKVRNLIRDSLQSIATAEMSYNPIKNIAQGINLTDRDSQEYVSALAGGGLIRFGTMLEGNEAARVRQLIKQGAKDSTILDNESKVRAFYDKYLEPAISAYNELGNRGEEINRAALFDQLKKQGVDHATASLMARDLMDFSLQGSWTAIRFLTQTVPFMNARLQGLYKLGRAAKDNPARFSAVIGATALFSIALMLRYKDDDDWKKREDWDRDNYWWFKFGGVAFRMPKPFEIGAIASLGERALELVIDKEMTGKRFADRVESIIGNQLSMNPIPQLVKPILDVYANKDSFTGRPIESMSMEHLKPDYRFTPNTSMVARAASTAGNTVTGDNFLSPVQIDHLIRGYFSWLGAFTVGAGDMAVRAATNEPTRPTMDYWKTATGGMVQSLEGAPSRYVTQMYNQAQEVEQAYGTWRQMLKEGNRAGAQEYLNENRDEIAQHGRIEQGKRSLALMHEQIRVIERSNMPADQKRDRINEIRSREDRVARLVGGVGR